MLHSAHPFRATTSWKHSRGSDGARFITSSCHSGGLWGRPAAVPLYGGLALALLHASQAARVHRGSHHTRRERGTSSRRLAAKSGDEDKFLRGKAVFEELRKKAMQDMARRTELVSICGARI
ncbi:mrkA [Symbiodinium pilosum]|uniref:MrkA protein n=1 Tax=Symbiodinium pilosum TaxID=2952 RepID=A0A812T0V6_SYMPI|nr:mrkA [Symbiodinium pilosum]